MSHVDDGRLHAYLDGTLLGGEEARREVEVHLDACANCRARLAVAAKDRDGAQRILGVLSPEDVSMPPFEELMARRRARGAAERAAQGTASPLRRLVPLAWAASIAVAVAGGWLARGALAPSPDRGALATTASGEDSAAASSPEGETPEVTAGRSASGREERIEPSADEAPGREEAPQAPDPIEPRVHEPLPTATGEQQPQVAARDGGAGLSDSASAREAPETALGRPDSGSTAADPFPSIQLREAISRRIRADPPAGAQEAAPIAPVPRGDVRLEALTVQRGRVPDSVDRSAVDRLMESERRATAAGAWTEVSPAEAATRLGEPPVEIEGLPWEEMEIAEVDGEVVVVRTVHPLPQGTRVELVQANWAPMTAATRERFRTADFAGAPLVAGHVTGSGLVVVLRGLEDRAALAELLERIR